MSFLDKLRITREPEYDKSFWDCIRGFNFAGNRLEPGRIANTGAYLLPTSADSKYEKAIVKDGLFRGLASVFNSYNTASYIRAADCDDLTEYVEEFGTVNIKSVSDDFTSIPLNSHKLAMLLRMSTEFVADASFDVENHLTKRLAKGFAHAEDKSFLLGDGVKEPVGILGETGGAEIAVQTGDITYDDVISLYFSVKSEYRKNAVWLMNDSTAMALRKLKDADGNYLWSNIDNTILGKRVEITEYMPNATAGAKPIAFGDFSYYWIVKRSPVTVKALKELYAINGQTGYLAFELLDGKLVRSDAVKVIQIRTVA